jgi:Icc-related predicted phosphoesterase
MIIDCISDLHGYYPQLEGGDLLIIAGDLTARDTPSEHLDFIEWCRNLPYKKIILIAGNHDGFIENLKSKYINQHPPCYEHIQYLCDSGTEFEGLKIWGSPWTPTFCDWHFMKNRGFEIKEKWDLIPDDINILITHSPPFGILDEVNNPHEGRSHVGCEELRKTIDNRLKNLKLHVFGHVHERHGYWYFTDMNTRRGGIIFLNASMVDENYRPVNKPIRIKRK